MKFVNGQAISEEPLVPAWVPPLVLAVLGALVLIGIVMMSRRTTNQPQTALQPVVTVTTPEATTIQGGAPGDANGPSSAMQGAGTGEAVQVPAESSALTVAPPANSTGAPAQVGTTADPLVPGSSSPGGTGAASPAPLPGSNVPRYHGPPLAPGEIALPGSLPQGARVRGMVPAH